MSWIQKLYETYENCQSVIGKIGAEKEVPLLPICHTTQKAHIEIVIDKDGNFKRARVVLKNSARTIIPCTEASGGRTSGGAAHPLCDKLQYVANDYAQYGGDKDPYFQLFAELLSHWCKSKSNGKTDAISIYIQKGTVISDLVKAKILFVDDKNKLLRKRPEPKKDKNITDIFDLLPGVLSNKGKWENWQADAFVRWEVEIPNSPNSKVWEDNTLWDNWIQYYSATKKKKTLCYVTGKGKPSADQHPAKLRNDHDKAKLISANDLSGFTFRGERFSTPEQVCSVGFEVTQKAHSALRWLISRQGKVFFVKGDKGRKEPGLTVVAWATSEKTIPRVTDDALSVLGFDDLPDDEPFTASTAQDVAIRFKNRMLGYASELGNTDNIMVMGMDSASKGRLAITYYREDLKASDFLQKIENWHKTCEWIHEYRYKDIRDKTTGKTIRLYQPFIGAPAPINIAEAAYGNKADDKLKKTTVARLLPCIIDGQQIPRDIVESAVRRACNRAGMEDWEWNKTLSIACSLYKKFNEKEAYNMALDESRKTRDYLYGRLLATADCLERFALFASEKKRDTNAARLMQRFADRPCSTWKTIELALSPYKARLGGRAKKYQDIIDEIMSLFKTADDYKRDNPLSGEFLLGYHCQREELKPKKDEPSSMEDEKIADE